MISAIVIMFKIDQSYIVCFGYHLQMCELRGCKVSNICCEDLQLGRKLKL